MQIKIAPSLLAADFSRLGDDVRAIDADGADLIHLDVMDGSFVPNLTFGLPVIKSIRPLTNKPFDAHLMVQNPDHLIPSFIQAGCNRITIHPETVPDIRETLENIRTLGAKAGVALNPATPIDVIAPIINQIDIVLVMTVEAGFGGQAFMPLFDKIKSVRAQIDTAAHPIDLMVDGGISAKNARDVIAAGANVLVAGTAIFANGADHYAQRIQELRG